MGPEMIGLFVPLGFFALVAVLVIGRPMVKAIAAKAEAESKQPDPWRSDEPARTDRAGG